jgi:hypothetical protein
MKIEMRAPAGLTGMSVEGFQIDVNEDGIAIVDNSIAHLLESHGFERTGTRDISGTRQDFVTQVFSRVRHIVENLKDENLQKILMLSGEAETTFWSGLAEGFVNGPDTLIRITSEESPKEKPTEPPKEEPKKDEPKPAEPKKEEAAKVADTPKK